MLDVLDAEILRADEVHVWATDPTRLEHAGAKSAAWALLTPEERERVTQYRFERDQLVSLATRALVRTVLSRYEPMMPGDWRFAAGRHGKPEIAGRRPPLRFNLSNTHGLLVCAVTRAADVGVDVEQLSREAPLDIAADFFAPPEVFALRSLEPALQPFRFFEYWTLKESYIKARGLGLSLPLQKFSFSLPAGQPPVVDIDSALADDGASWQFAQHRPTERHLVALCVRRHRGRPDLRISWKPLVSVP